MKKRNEAFRSFLLPQKFTFFSTFHTQSTFKFSKFSFSFSSQEDSSVIFGFGGSPISLSDGMNELMLEKPLSFSIAENLVPVKFLPPLLSHFSPAVSVKRSEFLNFISLSVSFIRLLWSVADDVLFIAIIELIVLRINRNIRYASLDIFSVSSGEALVDVSLQKSSSISLIVELFPSNLCFGERRLEVKKIKIN